MGTISLSGWGVLFLLYVLGAFDFFFNMGSSCVFILFASFCFLNLLIAGGVNYVQICLCPVLPQRLIKMSFFFLF